jgi:hypothetical protein
VQYEPEMLHGQPASGFMARLGTHMKLALWGAAVVSEHGGGKATRVVPSRLRTVRVAGTGQTEEKTNEKLEE